MAYALQEAWRVCERSNGAPRVIAAFLYKLREDPTWTEEELRQILEGVRARLALMRDESGAQRSSA